jgi:hypothetical protein
MRSALLLLLLQKMPKAQLERSGNVTGYGLHNVVT